MAWLTGWAFKKTVAVPAPGTNQTNVNIFVQVTWQAGMNADFSDVRFCDSDEETALYQYRKSYTASVSALFIIKIPSLTTAGKTVYLYFGNVDVSDASDAANTFAFYDTFADLTNWDVEGNVTADAGDLHLNMDNGAHCLAKSKATYSANYAVIAYMALSGGNAVAPFRYAGWMTATEIKSYFFKGQNLVQWVGPGAETQNRADPGLTPFEMRIDRISNASRKCYFDGALEHSQTVSDAGSYKIFFELWTTAYPNADLLVSWVAVLKYPDDGTVLGTLSPGSTTEMGKINREASIAYEHTASVWGTAVAPGIGDKILAVKLGPLAEDREVVLERAAGYAWHQYIHKGRKKAEPTIEAQLRYSGRQWSFLAQLMGLDTVAGADPYMHQFTPVDAIDGSDAFGTLTAMLGISSVALRFEWPSFKPQKISIFGPDESGFMRMECSGRANRLNLGIDTTMDKTDMEAVTHLLLDGALPPAIPFGALRARVNAAAGAALDAVDVVTVKDFRFDLQRGMDAEHPSMNAVANAWDQAEPIESGIPETALQIGIGDLNSLAWGERLQDETELKADFLWTFGSYSVFWEFPALRVTDDDAGIRSQDRIPQSLRLTPVLAASAPAGMTCTNFQVAVVDQNSAAYE